MKENEDKNDDLMSQNGWRKDWIRLSCKWNAAKEDSLTQKILFLLQVKWSIQLIPMVKNTIDPTGQESMTDGQAVTTRWWRTEAVQERQWYPLQQSSYDEDLLSFFLLFSSFLQLFLLYLLLLLLSLKIRLKGSRWVELKEERHWRKEETSEWVFETQKRKTMNTELSHSGWQKKVPKESENENEREGESENEMKDSQRRRKVLAMGWWTSSDWVSNGEEGESFLCVFECVWRFKRAGEKERVRERKWVRK